MTKKTTHFVDRSYSQLLTELADLLEQARKYSARSVNAIMTRTYWEVGQRIVDHEQQGKKRAVYGEALIERLALDLTAKFGRGFSQSNLWQMRDFYLGWPILQTVSGESHPSRITSGHSQNLQTLSGLSGETSLQRFPLPWSHYVRLLAVKGKPARIFYETEALRGGWSVRQLDRQIATQFYALGILVLEAKEFQDHWVLYFLLGRQVIFRNGSVGSFYERGLVSGECCALPWK